MSAPTKSHPDQARAFAAVSRIGPLSPDLTPLPGFTVADLWGDYKPKPYVVKRLLGPEELTVIFGQSGNFKSVIAIDLALSVASGVEFHGIPTKPGGVLYVAGEGHTGIKKRMRAWCMRRSIDASSPQPPVFVTSRGAELVTNPEQIRLTVEAASAVLGVPITLVVIDTLAANFGAGDENHTSDMTIALGNARYAAGGAAVLLVHHTGHGDTTRERGASALIAAADWRVQATYDATSKLIEAKWLKTKDDETPEPLVFEWRKVPIEWTDCDGEELTSVVLERLEGGSIPQGPSVAGLGKNQETALKALRTLYARNRKNLAADGRDPAEAKILLDGWRAECERRGIDRRRWHEVVPELQRRQLITLDGPVVKLAEVLP